MAKKSKLPKVHVGNYHHDLKRYQQLVNELYANHPPITLPSEYASFIEKDMLRFLIRLARYKFVARLIKKTDHLLEVGSGSGLGAIFLGQHCAKVTGLEVKKNEFQEGLSINRRKNVEFFLMDLFKLKTSKKYDAVISLDVIEHMPVPQGRRLLAAMVRQLKPNGMLVVGTPSIYSYPYQSALSRASHVKCYDQKELIDLIDPFFGRTVAFSMNDEMLHTGHPKMSWYYFVLAFQPDHSFANRVLKRGK